MMDIRHVVALVLFLVKGICGLLKEFRDFGGLEEGVRRLVQEAGQKVFVWALEELDEKLLKQRDRANLDVVRFCERTWVSTFGSLTVRRRLYGGRRTEEYRFLLGEALGWEPDKRLTERMEAMALELGTETPFRQAAKILEYPVPGVSPMAVWGVVKDAGEKPAPESMTLPTVDIGRMSAQAEDVEAWLRAKVPALTGPFASREWIKHVLRAITSIQEVA
ncbi:MAG: UPF0236 family transposase-like protein, partial [Bacillota bacterium]